MGGKNPETKSKGKKFLNDGPRGLWGTKKILWGGCTKTKPTANGVMRGSPNPKKNGHSDWTLRSQLEEGKKKKKTIRVEGGVRRRCVGRSKKGWGRDRKQREERR